MNIYNYFKNITVLKIVLLAKSKLNIIEVSISKAFIDSNISHDELVFINDVLKKMWLYEKKKQKIKGLIVLQT